MAILVILTIQKMRLCTPKMRLFWVWHINGHKYDQRKAKNRNVSPPGRFCGQLAEPFYWFQFYPMLKVFLLSNWAHILRGWIFLRPGFHEILFEAVEAVWNSEVARGRLLVSASKRVSWKPGHKKIQPCKILSPIRQEEHLQHRVKLKPVKRLS